jgi:hypothetical protein
MKITTDMAFVRSIATWQPITKNAGTGPGVLENVAIMEDGAGTLLVMATDRFRLIYARYVPNGLEQFDGKKLIPMTIFSDMVATNKTLKDYAEVVFEFSEEKLSVTVGGGVRTEYDAVRLQYPALENILQEFVADNTWPNDFKINMKLLADLPKFANPNVGVTTAAKRDYGWISTLGVNRAIRFHQGDMYRFGVVIMTMKY